MGGLDRFAACDMGRYIEIVKECIYVYVRQDRKITSKSPSLSNRTSNMHTRISSS